MTTDYLEIAGLVPPAGSGGPGAASSWWPIAGWSLALDTTVATSPGSPGDIGAGKVLYGPLAVAVTDPALVIPLFTRCATGEPFATVTLHVVPDAATASTAPAADLVTYTLTTVAVQQEQDAGAAQAPSATIAFEYASLAIDVPQAGSTGSKEGTPPGGAASPPSSVPEAPSALDIPVAAGVVAAGALAWRHVAGRPDRTGQPGEAGGGTSPTPATDPCDVEAATEEPGPTA